MNEAELRYKAICEELEETEQKLINLGVPLFLIHRLERLTIQKRIKEVVKFDK